MTREQGKAIGWGLLAVAIIAGSRNLRHIGAPLAGLNHKRPIETMLSAPQPPPTTRPSNGHGEHYATPHPAAGRR